MLYLQIFWTFIKIGTLGYGGGYAMMPLVLEETVEVRHWLTIEEFTDALTLGNALPGPIAPKMAFFIGYKTAGGLGAIMALLGVLLPSLSAMLLLGILFLRFKDHYKVKSVLIALRPAIIALLLWTIIKMSPSIFDTHILYKILITLSVLFFIVIAKVSPVIVLILIGLIGYLIDFS